MRVSEWIQTCFFFFFHFNPNFVDGSRFRKHHAFLIAAVVVVILKIDTLKINKNFFVCREIIIIFGVILAG